MTHAPPEITDTDQRYVDGLLDELTRAKRDDPERVPQIVAELQRVGHPVKGRQRTADKPPQQTR